MSIIEELGAHVRATSDELPMGLVTEALDRLRLAADRLRWVRQESANPMGLPELSAATEHAETAGHALRVAREQLLTYLTAIGLTGDGSPATRASGRAVADDRVVGRGSGEPEPGPGAAGRRWWSVRVTELTGRADPPPPDRRRSDQHPVMDAEELLRRVAGGVRSGDRGRLHAELRGVDADVGLGLAVVAPPVLRTLAGQLLGHPPRPPDLPRLRREVAGGVRDLLPGLPAGVLDTVLSRLCRVPPPKSPPGRANPADPAVAAGVLTGLLMHRLGHDTSSADRPAGHRETHE